MGRSPGSRCYSEEPERRRSPNWWVMPWSSSLGIPTSGRRFVTIRARLPSRELLGHVADEALDPLQLTGHIQSGNTRLAVAGLEQTAQEANHRGFAGAVRAKEPEDGALGDLETDVVNGGEVAKPFGQPFALDHHFAGHESIRWITSPKSNPPGVRKPA